MVGGAEGKVADQAHNGLDERPAAALGADSDVQGASPGHSYLLQIRASHVSDKKGNGREILPLGGAVKYTTVIRAAFTTHILEWLEH